MTEAAVALGLVNYLRKLADSGLPVWWVKYHGSKYTRTGVPDYLICYRGQFVAIELKASRFEKPSLAQVAQMRELERAGAITAVCYTIEQVKGLFDEIEQNRAANH